MFRLTLGFNPRHAAMVSMITLGLSFSVSAAESPTGGLGQAWPNAQDVSRSPQFHVYVFSRDGVRYIQVNDLSGNVRAAFATANGQFLVLPAGVDASHATTTQALPATSTSESVYNDGVVQVVVRSSDKGLVWTAASATVGTSPVGQGAKPRVAQMSSCTDPEVCNRQISGDTAPASSASTAGQ